MKLLSGPSRMGYALICFLIMSSLLLTLTLSLSCFVRIENQQKNISINRLKTKQAAKFALLLAQAQLTKSLTSLSEFPKTSRL